MPRTGRIKCGTESNGGFINIAISNCVFEGCQGYALESEDGALLEDFTITNTTMRDLVSGPVFMRLGSRLRGPKESTKVGTIKRILISNLECYNAAMKVSSILSGIPGYAIEDVKFSNIYVETAGGGPRTPLYRRSSKTSIPIQGCSAQRRPSAFSCATCAISR